jgi:peptidoglycan hydrolase CwlO-like protein
VAGEERHLLRELEENEERLEVVIKGLEALKESLKSEVALLEAEREMCSKEELVRWNLY